MNWLSKRMSRGAFVALATLVASACLNRTPAPPHVTLEGSVDSLRATFNTDSGNVRAIFLASPT
jgi:hypothetical protein